MQGWRRYRTRSHSGFKGLLFIAFILAFILLLDTQFRPVIKAIITNQARIKSVDVINRAISQELDKNALTYNDLVSIERDTNGKVLSITTQMVRMNQLKSVVIADVQKELGDDSHMDMGVPLGTLIGNDLLHGRGPDVPLRLTLSGSVSAEFKSTFESAGINQTKHQILLCIHTSIYSYIPWFDSTTEVETSIPVAETVIIGEVPQVVANIN
ncbi:sporulation protein YunB [Caproiciproducens galactitolivorans]|uniref:Sporulation protein YunB n=1 Tax=Caproiciproducens galactitolivorans TaxID=642589 RepID=A0A4Z0XX51_9FIRM|nr:sporulation protein YunB [Caproiciproducens galactitolivorans]QEY33949.1 sporulation protein YunB [Caproiciproducens galactitolivorans]TGJ76089.1 sporulation protein YunB [Caproiciproducens galactitolivorans]